MKVYQLNDDHTVTSIEFDECLQQGGFDSHNRIVEKTTIGDAEVSTVFLIIDHNFSGGEPILFETMIFGGSNDGFCRRYSTYQEAADGHRQIVEMVRKTSS